MEIGRLTSGILLRSWDEGDSMRADVQMMKRMDESLLILWLIGRRLYSSERPCFVSMPTMREGMGWKIPSCLA